MKMTKIAQDVIFDTIEMEKCFNEAKRAFEDYKEKKANHKEGDVANFIVCEDPGIDLDAFTNKRLQEFAKVSQGDVVLIEGKILQVVPANYQKEKSFKNKAEI